MSFHDGRSKNAALTQPFIDGEEMQTAHVRSCTDALTFSIIVCREKLGYAYDGVVIRVGAAIDGGLLGGVIAAAFTA